VDPTDELKAQMVKIQGYFLDGQKPQVFNPYDKDNVITGGEVSFEEVCATLEENGVREPKRLSEFEFYAKLQYYQKKYRELEKKK
jgi:hypothetical protein